VYYYYYSTKTVQHVDYKAVQHVHLTNIPVWFGLLGDVVRRTHVRLMHSTNGVCVCCLASGDTNLYGMMMYGG